MTDQLNRREFTTETIKALFAGVAITMTTGCGDDDSSSPTAPSGGGSADVSGSISANHGHVARIERASLSQGGAITLDIRGDSNHPHTVQLSAAEVTQIAAGSRVQKESSSDQSHSHTVTFN